MNGFMDFFQEKMVPPLVKMGNQKHLKAIRNGIAAVIPFIIVGSMFLIITNLPIPHWQDMLGDWVGKLGAAVNASFGVIAVLATIGIGYNLSKEYNLEPISGAMISLVAFLLTQMNEKYVLDTSKFDSSGLFTSIVVSIIGVEILRVFVKKGIIIKLPEGVPPAVANSFASLLPAAAVIVLTWFIRIVIGFDITSFLTLVFSPLVFALNTLPGIIVFSIFVCLLWSVGIHGDTIMGSIAEPIFLQYLAANTKAFASHQPIPYITAAGFWSVFICIGGTGATLALVLLMLKSKSKVYKSLGKLALPSSIFQINEPVIFGFPIVMNPTVLIPFVSIPLILTICTYILMYFNIIGRPVAMVPWTTPPIIGPFLTTGGDWRAAVWAILTIVISVIIYIPFFKVAEKEQLQLEKQEASNISVEV
ncbi:PTS sugar transporter subunit IIC [Clostridium brassicae]|uniref:Permease IIC component n=1 Tax=Clostridium brassicae TaxID=2999072 RepID=A0ABT4DFM4_9CLOT|nr:PTS sugar transporter subunit IIC [Clostridium brassicae]MCY6959926.1 PTS sugar transporter subunit IIC [Clostridium brassicae]